MRALCPIIASFEIGLLTNPRCVILDLYYNFAANCFRAPRYFIGVPAIDICRDNYRRPSWRGILYSRRALTDAIIKVVNE